MARRVNTNGIPPGIVTGTGKMTPEQLQARLAQKAVRIPHKKFEDTRQARNAEQALRSAKRRGWDD